jgi:hypothetical protein
LFVAVEGSGSFSTQSLSHQKSSPSSPVESSVTGTETNIRGVFAGASSRSLAQMASYTVGFNMTNILVAYSTQTIQTAGQIKVSTFNHCSSKLTSTWSNISFKADGCAAA